MAVASVLAGAPAEPPSSPLQADTASATTSSPVPARRIVGGW
jgi:hypothetical protein